MYLPVFTPNAELRSLLPSAPSGPFPIAATKHIDVWYHFIHECIADGSIDLKLVGTNDMVADILMKSLVHIKHERFCHALGMETIK